jgi:hypothetical protein
VGKHIFAVMLPLPVHKSPAQHIVTWPHIDLLEQLDLPGIAPYKSPQLP